MVGKDTCSTVFETGEVGRCRLCLCFIILFKKSKIIKFILLKFSNLFKGFFMPKLIEAKFGKIEIILDAVTHQAISENNWRIRHIDLPSLICIFESTNKAPGKKFIHCVHKTEGSDLWYITTSLGDVDIDDNGCIISTKNSIYYFKFGDFGLSEIEKVELKLNVLGFDSLSDEELKYVKIN